MRGVRGRRRHGVSGGRALRDPLSRHGPLDDRVRRAGVPRVGRSRRRRGARRTSPSFIDHTLLRADATYSDIDRLCDEAAQFGFASVCVNPMLVKRCAARLAGSSSVVCTVVGFPLGATPKEIKALEARRAIRDGAREIDMVIAIGALKSGDHRYV